MPVLNDYGSVGGNEVFNTARLNAYLNNMGSPFTTGSSLCKCDTLTATNLGSVDGSGNPLTAYDKPATDPAPWYDAAVPESAFFLGFLPLSIDGADDNPRARSVTNAVGGGGVFGPVREQPRSITVTGLLIGTTCCATDYGLHWLAEALAGCDGDSCDGGCFEMLNCCPAAGLTNAQLMAQHRRTFRRTALVSGPTVTERIGTGTCNAGSCQAGGDILQVEFVLVAGSPWPWTDTIPILDVAFPIGGSGACIEWCLPEGDPDACFEWDTTGSSVCNWVGNCLDIDDPTVCTDPCIHAECVDPADKCADPLSTVPAPPEPTAPNAPFCIPLSPERACYTIDLSTRPEWSDDAIMITVTAGSTELRNVRIVFFEKPNGTTQTCDQIADANRCNPYGDFYITYIPAGGSVTIDGQIGRATSECGGDCTTASTVFGNSDGGPVRMKQLTCAQYCVCLESDTQHPPATDARFSLSVSGRGY